MLLKLTCPSCGRVEQVSDRVLGKEIRCPCGTQFRVLQPKPTAKAAPQAPAQSQVRRSTAAQPYPVESKPRPSRPPAPRRAVPLEDDEPPVPFKPKRKQNSGMPPWAYAAVGAGGVMSLLFMIFVIKSLLGGAPEPATPSQAAPTLVATQPAQEPKAPAAQEQAPIETAAADPEPEQATEPEPAAEAPPAPAPAPSGKALSTADIVARCEPSVALIKGGVSSGTGFVIKRGIIATNAHVIEDELLAAIEVRFPSAPKGKQGPHKPRLLYEDRKRDIAFLEIQSDLPVLELAPNYAFRKGEDITVIGNPGLGEDVVLENAISRGVMSSKIVIEGMNYYQMSIAINPGNSGGPVFDSTGGVIGVATLKSNKAEAMGFCIPVEELRVAMKQLGQPHPEMLTRHRAVATFKALTLAGAMYVVGIVARAGKLEGADSDAVQKIQEAVKELDQKLFSQVDAEIAGLQHDSALSPRTRRNYQELSSNYKAMKNVYGYSPQQVMQSANHIEELRKQHLNLVMSIKDALRVEVAEKLLAVLKEPLTANQQQVVVVDVMPPGMQRGFQRGPGRSVRPRGQVGPGAMNPGQQMHNQMMRRMEQQRRDMENRMRNMHP